MRRSGFKILRRGICVISSAADLKFKLSTSELKFKKLGGCSKPRRINLGEAQRLPLAQNAVRWRTGLKTPRRRVKF